MAVQKRSSASLALLALLTSAVVVVTRGNNYFTLWDSVIGAIIVSVAVAYRHEVTSDTAYRIAFSLIVAAGLLLIAAPFVELGFFFLAGAGEYEGPLLLTPDKLGYDALFVGLWLAFALGVFVNLPGAGKR